MKRTRSLLGWGALAVIAASANAFAAKSAANPIAPVPNFDVGSIIGDAMSPVNPYNSGADPITMPGDARMAVFTYTRSAQACIWSSPQFFSV
ncbi:hypothetical protein [Burkholderia multivorans]|uniref:hypothetical protein n=1 Tax=Burkholderia multivorans TaxID=87883 RepID=UPI002159819C|nr:hypothetical protein [Burkholderia multivorans]